MKNKFYIVLTLVLSVILILASVYLSVSVQRKPQLALATVATHDITQGVKASGDVVAEQDLELGFQATGTVSRIYVNIGDHVKAGQTLASLDNKTASAAIS